MKKSIIPILYDLKRSIIRLSTITLLVIFILLGIGVSYTTANFFKQMYPTLGVYIYGSYNSTYCYLNGVVIDAIGKPVDKFELVVEELVFDRTIRSATREIIDKFELDGILALEGSVACRILEVLQESVRDSNLSLPGQSLEKTSHAYREVYVRKGDKNSRQLAVYRFAEASSATVWLIGGLITPHQLYSPSISLITNGNPSIQFVKESLFIGSYSIRKGEVVLLVHHPIDLALENSFLRIEYSLLKEYSGDLVFENTLRLNYTYLGEVVRGQTNLFTINTGDSKAIVVKITDSFSLKYIGLIQISPPIESSFIVYIAGTSGIGLYYVFFPILFLYIAYIFIAKPRTTGSLEFLLARPITRKDIYINRFIAGVMLAFTTTGLFLLSLNIASRILIGYSLDTYGFTIVYLGLTASLVSMYSLFYFISTSLRGGMYLGVSIFIYLILYMFWSLIIMIIVFTTGLFSRDVNEAFRLMYLASYFNPAGIYDFANVYLFKHYNISYIRANMGMNINIDDIEPIINPVAVFIQPILFTTTFLLAGYAVFRRANLSQ
ncbi:MAG: ABC transporter permease subunit [Desulfurococcaceae archaeon]